MTNSVRASDIATPVRVPKVLAVCEDASVIGAPFYVMERLTGEVITDTLPPALDSSQEHARIADQLVGHMAHLRRWSA